MVNRMYLSGRGNNIYEQGQIITEQQVLDIDACLANGSVIPFDREVEPTEPVEPVLEPVVEPTAQVLKEDSEYTKAEIVLELTKRQIQFDPAQKKSELYDLLVANF